MLTDEDIDHYQKIVVALNESIRLMREIDEVIDAHGGWPGAFVTNTSGQDSRCWRMTRLPDYVISSARCRQVTSRGPRCPNRSGSSVPAGIRRETDRLPARSGNRSAATRSDGKIVMAPDGGYFLRPHSPS